MISALAPATSLLLGACFLPDRQAALAYRAWRAHEDFEDLSAEAFALLPLLPRRLDILVESGDNARARIKGVWRRSFWRNQQLLEPARRLMGVLREADLPVVLSGTSALAASGLVDGGERPLDHAELLVSAPDALRALGLLEREGWRWPLAVAPSFAVDHAAAAVLRHQEDRRPIRIAWRASGHSGGDDNGLWSRTHDDQQCLEDQLVCAALHGSARGGGLDALTNCAVILERAADRLRWDSLLAASNEQRHGWWVRRVLEQAGEVTARPVARDVLDDIAPPVSRVGERVRRLSHATPAGRMGDVMATIRFALDSPQRPPRLLAHALVTHNAGSTRELARRALRPRRQRRGGGGA